MINGAATNGDTVSDGVGGTSLIEDAQPYYDHCSTRDAVSLTGTNVGDNLNAVGLSWGWFQGGAWHPLSW
jgi:phospholipase C